jgi:hypothetical protein
MRRTALLILTAAIVLLSAGAVNPAEIGRCGGAATISFAHQSWWTC